MRMRALALAAGLVMLVVAPARAQSDDDSDSQLGGYVAGAGGWAVSVQPIIPALLPTGDAPAEATLSLSTANVKSGGNSLGRAALVWPGSAAANLGPLLGAGAGQPFVGAILPPYPGFVEASAKDGELQRSVPPALVMRAFGSSSRGEGDVRTPDVNLPGLLKIDSVSSQSVAEVTDVDVTASAVVNLEGISILNGAIKATSIYSKSLTRSTGDSSVADGALNVVGLTVTGIAVEVTGDGIHAVGLPPEASAVPGVSAPVPGTNPDEALNTALKALNTTIRVTRLSQKAEGGNADRLANALLISVDTNGALPGSRVDITLASTGSAAQATPTASLDLGALDVAPDIGDETVGSDVLGASDTSTLGGDFASSPEGGLALGPAVLNPGADATSGPPATSLAGYSFEGVSWGLVLVLAVVTLLVARWLRGFLGRRLL